MSESNSLDIDSLHIVDTSSVQLTPKLVEELFFGTADEQLITDLKPDKFNECLMLLRRSSNSGDLALCIQDLIRKEILEKVILPETAASRIVVKDMARLQDYFRDAIQSKLDWLDTVEEHRIYCGENCNCFNM